MIIFYDKTQSCYVYNTVYSRYFLPQQEISSDIGCFEAASQSEEPLFTLCDIVLSQIESSIDNVMKTNNFTMPIRLIIELYKRRPGRLNIKLRFSISHLYDFVHYSSSINLGFLKTDIKVGLFCMSMLTHSFPYLLLALGDCPQLMRSILPIRLRY